MLEGLFDTLPVVADDVEARNAVWFIMSRILGEAVNKFSKESLYWLAEMILDKIVIIEESMNLQLIEEPQDESTSNDYVGLHGVRASVSKITFYASKLFHLLVRALNYRFWLGGYAELTLINVLIIGSWICYSSSGITITHFFSLKFEPPIWFLRILICTF